MHIQCTTAMIDYIKPNLTEHNTYNEIYVWYSHLVKRRRKYLLLLIQDLSRFTLVYMGLRKVF